MKRLILLLSLVTATIVQAQTTLPPNSIRVPGTNLYANKDFNNPSAPKEVVYRTSTTTTSCSCSLNDVCLNGDSASTMIYAIEYAAAPPNSYSSSGYYQYDGLAFGNHANSYSSSILSGNITGPHTITTPDEDGEIVTHLTQNKILVGDTSGPHNYSGIDSNDIFVNSGPDRVAGLGRFGSNGLLSLKNGSTPYFSFLRSHANSAHHFNFLPNEDGDLVTHYTASNIYVGDTSGAYTFVSPTGCQVVESGYGYAAIEKVGTDGVLLIKNSLHAGNVVRSVATSARSNNLPDDDGEFLINHSSVSTQTLTAATSMIVTHSLGYIPGTFLLTWYTTYPASPRISSTSSTTFTISWPVGFTGAVTVHWVAVK